MGWIQEKSKDLDNFDDLESSLVMLEEVSSKFEVNFSYIAISVLFLVMIGRSSPL